MIVSLVGLPVLLLLVLSFAGFFLPPPKRRPDGLFYGLCLLMFHAVCGLMILDGCLLWSGNRPRMAGVLIAPALVAALGVSANTFWVRGAFRSLPEGMDKEDSKDALGRLHSRLWGVLLGGVQLAQLLPWCMVVWFSLGGG